MEIHPKKKIQPTPTTCGSGILKRKPQTTQRHRHHTCHKTTRPLGTSNTYHRFTAVTTWPQGHVLSQGGMIKTHMIYHQIRIRFVQKSRGINIHGFAFRFCSPSLGGLFPIETLTGFVISSWKFHRNGCMYIHGVIATEGMFGGYYNSLSKQFLQLGWQWTWNWPRMIH